MALIPLAYNWRNPAARRVSTGLTALGIALVAWVFIFTLALAGGFQAALQTTGSPNNAIVIRKGSTAELMSIINRDAASAVMSQEEIARAPDDTPLAASELIVVWNLPRKSGTTTNVVVRGVGPKSLALRPQVRLAQGRMFRTGLDEIVVGKMVSDRFRNCAIGDHLKLAGRVWTVVGILDSGGRAYDSEIWGDVELFMPVFDRPVFQSVTLRLREPAYLKPLKQRLESDPRMSVEVEREDIFYSKQSGALAAMFARVGPVRHLDHGPRRVRRAQHDVRGRRCTDEEIAHPACDRPRGAILTSFLIESVLLSLLAA